MSLFMRVFLTCIVFSVPSFSQADAACSPPFKDPIVSSYGAAIKVLARSTDYSGSCSGYGTDSSQRLNESESVTSIGSHDHRNTVPPQNITHAASADASVAGLRASAAIVSTHVHGNNISIARARVYDEFAIQQSKEQQAAGGAYIPVRFCSTATAKIGISKAVIRNAYKASFTWDNANGSKVINHAQAGTGLSVCHTGKFHFTGSQSTLKIGIVLTGNAASNGPSNGHSQSYSGTVSTSLSVNASAVHCVSNSGVGRNCRPQKPKKHKDCPYGSDGTGEESGDSVGNNISLLAGNPVNIALGYKAHRTSDYAGGMLSFSRAYRSDSTWTGKSIGQRWRHNFLHDLDISTVDGALEASALNTDGSRTAFTQNGSTWIARDLDTVANFTDDPNVAGGYIYINAADTRHYYDANHNLSRLVYRGGETLGFAYDSDDRLLSVIEEDGRALTFFYSGTSSHIESITTPDGTVSYSYDALGNLANVTALDGTTITYHYENAFYPYAMTGITDQDGARYATYEYDDVGRVVVSKHHATGYEYANDGSRDSINEVDTYQFIYNDDGTTTINPLGRETIYTFETINGVRKVVNVEGIEGADANSCAGGNKGYTYNDRGFMTSKTDWQGNVTNFTYDARGLVSSMVEDAGGSDARTTTYTYDPVHRLPDVITEEGRTTNYDHDNYGRVVQMSVSDGTNARTTLYDYFPTTQDANGVDVLGKLERITDARRNVTRFRYDNDDNLEEVENALGHLWRVYARDAHNRVTEILDPNGIKTKITYDVMGRVTKVTEANNRTAEKGSTIYSYNADGSLYKVTLDNGVFTKYFYDDSGKVSKVQNSDSGQYFYRDAAGNLLETKYKKIGDGNPITYRLFQKFDELSRLTSTRNNSNTVGFEYDLNNNLTALSDADGDESTYSYDGLQRLRDSSDRLGGQANYDLNALDHLSSVTDPRTNITSYIHNGFGEVTQETSRDRGVTSYIYDANGNQTSMTDARGITTNYSYDALNRLTGIDYPTDTDVVLEYDLSSGCGESKGRLCRVTDDAGVTDYAYNAKGDVITVTKQRGSQSYTTNYAYDNAHYLTSVTYPSGRVVNYSYDGNGDVSQISMSMGGVTTVLADNITYLAYGGAKSMDYGNGLSASNTYDDAYRLTGRSVGTVMSDTYTYDDNNNVKRKNGTDRYDYDVGDRLIKEADETTSLFNAYDLDLVGNRTLLNLAGSANDVNYLYEDSTGAESNRLLTVNGVNQSYNAAGYITNDGNFIYDWDDAGRLSSITVGLNTVATYSYDSQNRRTSKTVGGITTTYLYSGAQVTGEYDANGVMIREYVYIGGVPLAQMDAGSTEVVTYLHTDNLGTPRIGTDESGAVVWQWSSTQNAYGQSQPVSSGAEINLRMAGQYYDSESGLFYNWNRYYNPATGRYISSDPIGLAGGLNTFAYVNANPVMYIDPEGLQFDNGQGDFEYWRNGIVNGCKPSMWGCPETISCKYCAPEIYQCLGNFVERATSAIDCGTCALSRGALKHTCASCAAMALTELVCRAKYCKIGEKHHSLDVCHPVCK